MASDEGDTPVNEEVARLREALEKAESARQETAASMDGLLKQLQTRSERLIASETELEVMRNKVRAIAADAPMYLRQRVVQADQLRKQAEAHAKKVAEQLRDKGHELQVLEGLVGRYQTELMTLSSKASEAELQMQRTMKLAGARVEESVWENQRLYRVVGWSEKLLPTDRPSFSDDTGAEARSKEGAELPAGWAWVQDWQLVVTDETDKEGWTYGFDFPQLQDPTERRSAAEVDDCVRRRCWVRNRLIQSDSEATEAGNHMLALAFNAGRLEIENEQLRRQVEQLKRQAAAAPAKATSPRASPKAAAPGSPVATKQATGEEGEAAGAAGEGEAGEGGDGGKREEGAGEEGAATAAAPAAEAAAAPPVPEVTVAPKGKKKKGKKKKKRVAAIADDDL